MSLLRKEILAVSLAALSVAALIVTIYLTAPSADSLPANSPLLRDLVSPQVAQNERPTRPEPDYRPPAFRVDTVTIPAAALMPNVISVARIGSTAGLPQPSMPQLSVPQPYMPEQSMPELVRPQRTEAVAMPETVGSPAASHPTSALEVAMHPSLKYGRWVLRASLAPTIIPRASKAAFDVPIAVVEKKTAVLAASLRSPPPPTITDFSDAERERLIDANLKMEEDRQFVMSMCQDHQGRIWVGTECGGVQRFDPSAPEFHQWTQFTTKDGLGDDNAYAIACDHLGRIWVGHLNHGVSVFNGQKWQCYDVVGGLSQRDALSGPIGERVFAIAVCPVDGDVWIATSGGLTRYSEQRDTWRTYTREDGLPSDQVQAIAFDNGGRAYAGTQCDGIAIADPTEQYLNWRTLRGPEQEPSDPSGLGLPTNLLNAMLVATNGAVFAATPSGLAWSNDRGQSWRYVRGTDYASKVLGRIGGPPTSWKPQPGAILADDYVTSIAEAQPGVICIGYRRSAPELLQAESLREHQLETPVAFTTSLLAVGETGIAIGTYGSGVQLVGAIHVNVTHPAPDSTAKFPATAAGEDVPATTLDVGNAAGGQEATKAKAIYLGDDWRTQGSWLGRYGRYWSCLAGMAQPDDLLWGSNAEEIRYFRSTGPHINFADFIYTRTHSLFSESAATLEIPRPIFERDSVASGSATAGDRRPSEWEDHGEAHPWSTEGPDLRCILTIPRGPYIISLYNSNFDARDGLNCCRDYEVQLYNDPNAKIGLLDAPFKRKPDAHCRVVSFYGGCYKRFLVCGPSIVSLCVRRNYSVNTILAAVMLDKAEDYPEPYFAFLGPPPSSAQDGQTFNPVELRGRMVAYRKAVFERGDEPSEQLLQLEAKLLIQPLAWALARRRAGAETLRSLLGGKSIQQCPMSSLLDVSSAARAACYFQASERCLGRLGLFSERDVEMSLHWDHRTEDYDGLRFQLIKDVAESQPAILRRIAQYASEKATGGS